MPKVCPSVNFCVTFLTRSFWSSQVSAISARFVSYNLQPPAKTMPRVRPSQDICEWWVYWSGRQVRWFDFYYHAAKECTNLLLANVLRLVVIFRCLGICCGAGKLVRWLLETVGLQEEINMQQHWFRSVKHMLNTDLMLWQGAASSLFMGSVLVKRADAQGIACVLLGIAALIAFDILLRFGIVRKRWLYRRAVQRTVLLPMLVVMVVVPMARRTFCVVYFGLAFLLWQVERLIGCITEKQHQWFSEQWENKYKALTLGECPSSNGELCPCPCTHPQEDAPPSRRRHAAHAKRWPPLPRWLRRLRRRACKRSCKRRLRRSGHERSKDSLASDTSTASWCDAGEVISKVSLTRSFSPGAAKFWLPHSEDFPEPSKDLHACFKLSVSNCFTLWDLWGICFSKSKLKQLPGVWEPTYQPFLSSKESLSVTPRDWHGVNHALRDLRFTSMPSIWTHWAPLLGLAICCKSQAEGCCCLWFCHDQHSCFFWKNIFGTWFLISFFTLQMILWTSVNGISSQKHRLQERTMRTDGERSHGSWRVSSPCVWLQPPPGSFNGQHQGPPAASHGRCRHSHSP